MDRNGMRMWFAFGIDGAQLGNVWAFTDHGALARASWMWPGAVWVVERGW